MRLTPATSRSPSRRSPGQPRFWRHSPWRIPPRGNRILAVDLDCDHGATTAVVQTRTGSPEQTASGGITAGKSPNTGTICMKPNTAPEAGRGRLQKTASRTQGLIETTNAQGGTRCPNPNSRKNYDGSW